MFRVWGLGFGVYRVRAGPALADLLSGALKTFEHYL